MLKIDDVLNTIDNNKNLTREFKEDFKGLTNIYLLSNENADLSVFIEIYENLNIEKGNKYVSDEPIKFEGSTLVVNEEELEKDYDVHYLLMRQIVLMESERKRIKGYQAICQGYASMYSNLLIGNSGTVNPYEDEMVTVNLLCDIVGLESIEELVMNNNEQPLLDNVTRAGNNLNEFKAFNEEINYNLSAKDIDRNKSMIASVQVRLIDMFLNQKNVTQVQVETFRSNLFGNNAVFGNNEKYQTPNNVYGTFNQSIDNLQLNNLNEGKTR